MNRLFQDSRPDQGILKKPLKVTAGTTIDEAKQILSAGFDYITQKDGIMLFRRPKRFRLKQYCHKRRSTMINLK